MKKYHIITPAVFVGLLLASCNLADGIGDDAENAVFMGNPNSAGVVSVLASDDTGAEYAVTPRLAAISDKPVEVTVKVDTKTLEEHNAKFNLALVSIAPEDVTFVTSDGKTANGEITTTIKPGDVQTSIAVRINSLDPKKYPYKDKYAIPVKLVKASADKKLLSSPLTTIIALNRKIKTSVIKINQINSGISINPNTPFTEELTEWTFQMGVMYTNLSLSNLTTAYMSGTTSGEFYTRINSGTGIQIKNGRDGDDTWTQKPLKTNEWLNISYVYKRNGLGGTVKVYVNGELQQEFTTTALFFSSKEDAGWVIGNGNWGNTHLREVRFWNRALTETEILDKQYMPQDPKSKGLLMYVPFDASSYDAEKDAWIEATGNWKIAVPAPFNYNFVENVVFPSNTLVIEE